MSVRPFLKRSVPSLFRCLLLGRLITESNTRNRLSVKKNLEKHSLLSVHATAEITRVSGGSLAILSSDSSRKEGVSPHSNSLFYPFFRSVEIMTCIIYWFIMIYDTRIIPKKMDLREPKTRKKP